MKAMMSVLFVMITALALVSSVEAGTCSFYSDNPGAYSHALNTPAGVCAKSADRAADVTKGINSPCALSGPPAYTDYVNAREVPPTANTTGMKVPVVMGSWN